MSNLTKHAEREFAILGWPGDDKMQQLICRNVLDLLKVLSGQGHSGSSHGYLMGLFVNLADFKPISPLTGADDEWIEVDDGMFQNRRDSEVFKENGDAYWIHGKIFRDADGSTWTNTGSRVPVMFPWVRPKPRIIERESK